jgi:hypothetical protein
MDEQRPTAANTTAEAAESAAVGPEPETPFEAEPQHESGIGFVGHLHNVAGPVAGAIGSFFEAAGQVWSVPESSIGRLLGRKAREPLANLYEIYPEARQASPHELGLRFVPIEDIRGTAVAGAAQRGGDFLPLKPFRGENWEGRWRRIMHAHERLQALPPVDLIKFDGDYWVVDGHNRVGAVLYNRGIGVDAMVTELVPLDGRMSERPRNLLSYLGDAAELRAAAQGHRPAMGMRQTEQLSSDEAANIPLEGYADTEAEADTEPDEAE